MSSAGAPPAVPEVAAGGRLYVGGRWRDPVSGATTTVVSPATEEPVGAAAVAGPADVDAAVAAAREAIDRGPWADTTPAERIELVGRIGEAYGARRRDLANTITREMGAPISFSKMAQAMLPWSMCGAFAGLAAQHTWEESRPGLYGSDVLVRKEPVGVVGAIVPWNMPQFLMVAKLAPALLAGNAVVVKPALETPLDALILAEVLDEVGLPAGVVSILPGDGAVGAHLAAHPDVDMVSFTGSTAVGREVGAVCGGALKRAHLELGGKSAAIVLDDADAAAVAEGIKVAGFMNSGQACVAQTRILVPEARRAEVVEALAEMVGGVAVGDPEDKATEIGPLVSRRQQERVRGHIDRAVGDGARLVVGGSGLPAGVDRGWYITPTLFDDVDSSMAIAQEEVFGPVLTVLGYTDDDDAVRLADDTAYGLSGSVWTADVDRGLGIARRVRSGTFGVNQPYSMDPAGPFGGMKASGLGREMGREGLDEYLEVKAISIAPIV